MVDILVTGEVFPLPEPSRASFNSSVRSRIAAPSPGEALLGSRGTLIDALIDAATAQTTRPAGSTLI